MRLVSTGCNNAAAQNLGDHLGGFGGTVHAVISKLIRSEALRVEFAEAGFVTKERAAGHGHAAREQNFQGRIEPKHNGPCGAEKFRAAGLRVGAAAQGDDGAFLKLGSTAERGAELVRLDLAESELAEALENLRDGEAGGRLNALVEINKAPSELAGEERTDGGLAGAHEPSQAENRDAGWKPAGKRRNCHAVVAKLVALQNANCTTVGGEFDFRQAGAESADNALGKFPSRAPLGMGIGFEKSGGLIVDCSGGGLGLEVKGIVAGEADFHQAFTALHGVEARGDKIAIKQNVAEVRGKTDVGQCGLQDLCATADRLKIQLAGTLRADQGAFRCADNDIARDFLEVHVAFDAFQSHVAHHLFNIDEAGFGFELEFGFFRYGELQVSVELPGLCRGIHEGGSDVNAVAHLFHVETDLVGGLIGDDQDFRILRRFHFNTAIGHVLNYDDRPALYGKMLFDALP